MKTLNKVYLLGRLGHDPEFKAVNNGVKLVNFSLATETNIKRGDKWETQTEWHRIVAFQGLADLVEKKLKKGSRAFIEGRIQTKSWTDDNGNKRFLTEIIAKNLIPLDTKKYIDPFQIEDDISL